MPKQDTLRKVAAFSGILAPVLAFVFILSAIASYPPFSWTDNALSDLGIQPGVTSWLFNLGLIAAGILAFVFAVFGLYTFLAKGRFFKIGSLVFAAATLALVAIGIFNESYSPTHYLVSVAFFFLAPISLFIITCGFYMNRQFKMAALTVLVGVVAALPWLFFFAFNYATNVAIPELISGLAIWVWTIAIGVKMLKSTT